MESVQPIQVAQCVKELFVRCSDPLSMRRKMYLLGNYNRSVKALELAGFGYLHEEQGSC